MLTGGAVRVPFLRMINFNTVRTIKAEPAAGMHAANVARMNTTRKEAAAILGSATSAKKTAAAQSNGKKGGRPEGS